MAAGAKQDPWTLKTPPGTSPYTLCKDEQADPPALVCQSGSTTPKYHLRAIEDLRAWLAAQDDWVSPGAADEKKPAAAGTAGALGSVTREPGRQLARAAQWLLRPVRPVPALAAGELGPGRSHPPHQADARRSADHGAAAPARRPEEPPEGNDNEEPGDAP